jgi:asparagine synthase (glutamine-hydrolysing)
LRQALLDSVDAHLVADVDVGIFLSAGIDSASVLGLAAELHGRMSAVTLGFDEYLGTPSDEVPLAKRVAELYGAEHTVETVRRSDFDHAFDRLLSDMDQPSIDGVNTWLVSRAAHNSGLKVALSGTGGDELFGGYSTFETVPRWAARLKWPAQVPGLGRATTSVLRRLLPNRISPKAAGVVEYGDSLERAWFVRRALFMPWELPALLGEDRALAALEALNLPNHLGGALKPDPGTDFGRVAALEGALYMRNQLLRDTDWASMAHSLEVRVPLVDPVLLNRVAPVVTQEWSAAEGKLPLGRVARPHLPDEVLFRAKSGFSVPVGDWLTRAEPHQAWRRVPALQSDRCPWARRWAYTVADQFGLLNA